jgi:phosphonate transport system substrate-binding protein
MAENTEAFCRALAVYIHHRLAVRAEYVEGVPWQERERLFDRGEIQLLWLCGLPYVQKADSLDNHIELLAVPVPQGSRYHGRPIYFSDVVVRRKSCFESFEHLRGSVWAYNEPRSHSGFNVVRAYLAARGETDGFFKKVVESGAQSTSLEWILNGGVDVTAIDSTVLEWLVAQRPNLQNEIRVLASLGPSPIPPWVISKSVSEDQRFNLQSLLLGMDRDMAGCAVLRSGRIQRFVGARDCDYDPIRRMAETADRVSLA